MSSSPRRQSLSPLYRAKISLITLTTLCTITIRRWATALHALIMQNVIINALVVHITVAFFHLISRSPYAKRNFVSIYLPTSTPGKRHMSDGDNAIKFSRATCHAITTKFNVSRKLACAKSNDDLPGYLSRRFNVASPRPHTTRQGQQQAVRHWKWAFPSKWRSLKFFLNHATIPKEWKGHVSFSFEGHEPVITMLLLDARKWRDAYFSFRRYFSFIWYITKRISIRRCARHASITVRRVSFLDDWRGFKFPHY